CWCYRWGGWGTYGFFLRFVASSSRSCRLSCARSLFFDQQPVVRHIRALCSILLTLRCARGRRCLRYVFTNHEHIARGVLSKHPDVRIRGEQLQSQLLAYLRWLDAQEV